MNSLFLAVLLAAVLAAVWIFYDRFTERGGIPLDRAWKDYTAWWGYVGLALAEWIVEIGRYMADVWPPLQAQLGDLLAADSLSTAIQVISAIFLLFKLKGQQRVPFPNIPSPGGSRG